MSTLEVNKITPSTGTSITLGDSGDTFTVPTGVGVTVTDEIKTNKISPASGTSFTMGDSGDTFTIPSGVTLTNNGTASGFGGGKIGQVIQTSLDGIVEITSSSGTFVDITGFNASITPSATSSKILVNCSINYGGTGNLYGATRLLRGSTAIGVGASAGSRTPATVFTSSGDLSKAVNSAVQFLDTPSTTSSTTYKLQVTLNSGQTFKLNSEGENIDNAANHRTISTITLMEVLA